MDLTGMPTILDIAKMRGNDIQVGLIEESIQVNPEMRLFPARQISGTAYKTLIRTGYPTAQFRRANDGVPRSKSTFENRTVECFILDLQIAADKAIADAWEPGGAASYQMVESVGVMEAVMRRLGRQIYYGNSPLAVTAGLGDPAGFPGLIDAYDNVNFEIDAGGASNDPLGLTSVWAVKLGIKDCHIVAGANSTIDILPEWRIQTVQVEDNRAFTAYVNSLMGWIGMQVGSVHSVARIKNIGTVATHTMNDLFGARLIELFPSGILPDYFIMNRRSRRQLRESRIAAQAGIVQPNSIPMPTDIDGIPIIWTDAIANSEQLILPE